jgi:hypothetical protein
MKAFLSRRFLKVAALISPFVLVLSAGVATAQAALIRGRGGERIQVGSSGLHGVSLGITVAAVVLVVVSASYFGIRSSLKASTVSQPVPLPVERNADLDDTRKAA